MKYIFVLIVLFALFMTGCATMFNSGAQPIYVQSSDDKPTQVRITSKMGVRNATLPMTLAEKPGDKIIVQVIETQCVYPSATEVNRSITPSWWLNILWCFACPLSSTTDGLTGAMWVYDSHVVVPVNVKPECN